MDAAAATGSLAFQPYQQREARRLGVRRLNGWTLKLYGLRALPPPSGAPFLEEQLVRSVLTELQAGPLARPPGSPSHGLGFLIIHKGSLGDWVLLDRWADEIHLYHQLYQLTSGGLQSPPKDLAACLWEIEIIAFERAVWIKHMMAADREPHVAGYLSEWREGRF